MIKQEENDHKDEASKISEQVPLSATSAELDANTLEEAFGAGPGNAIKGWKYAADYQGNVASKMKSAWYGLTHSKGGSSTRTKRYAWEQVMKK